MPIVHEYRVPAALRAEALAAGSGAMAGEDQRRYQDQLAHRDRLFEYQLDQAAVDNQLRADSLGQQRYMFNAGQAQQAAEFGARNQLAWAGMGLEYDQLDQNQQRLDQNAWAIEQDAIANNVRANAAIEQQRMKLAAAQQQQVEERKMAQAVRSQDQIMKHPFSSQAQYDAAVQQWEQQTGLDWDFPQRAIAEQQQKEGAARRQSFVTAHANMLGLDPAVVDGLTVDTEAGPMIPDKTLASLTSIATAKMNNERIQLVEDKNIAAAADKAAKELQIKTAETRHTYEADVQAARAKVIARFNKLKTETAAALTKQLQSTNPDTKAVEPDALSEEVLARLLQQAKQENPLPPPPPGI